MNSLINVLTVAFCLSVSVPVVTGLECYACSYIKIETSDAEVTKALANLTQSANEGCKTANLNASTVQKCSTPPSGVVSKCSSLVVKADASTSAAAVDFKMDIVTRSCSVASSSSNDACQEVGNEAIQTLNTLYGGVLTISSLHGKACACSMNLCNGQSRITSEKLFWLSGTLLAVLGRQLW